MLASTPFNGFRSVRSARYKGYAETPIIRNARLLLFPFQLPVAVDVGRSGVERGLLVQERMGCKRVYFGL